MPNSQYQQDLDGGFIGFESRTNASLLKQQYLQMARNMRLERGHAQARKGVINVTPQDVIVNSNPIYASCKYVDTDGHEYLVLVSDTSVLIYDPDVSVGTVNRYLYPAGRTVSATDEVNCFQAIDKLFILRGEPSKATSASFAYTNGSRSVTVTSSAHGLVVGDELIISGAGLDAIERGTFVVTAKTAGTFTYLQDTNSANGHTHTGSWQKGKPPLVLYNGVVDHVLQGSIEGTDANFPPSSVGMFYGNRVIIKRDRDKIAASDYLSEDHWDLTMGQFTINQGAWDHIIGFTPWADNEFLIFERNTIFRGRIENDTYVAQAGPSTTSYIDTVTTAFGCVGPKAIVNAGRFVFFLSDNGIYMLEPQLDLKLVSSIEPLSAPINDQIGLINRSYSYNSCGIYHNNRLYMAVPTTTTYNDTIFVFNVLNKAWESVDSYYSSGTIKLNIKNLVECTYMDKKRLFCITDVGVFLMEESSLGDEVSFGFGVALPHALPFQLNQINNTAYPINMSMTTRKFSFGSTREKRYSGVAIEVEFPVTSSMETAVTVYNPDGIETIDKFQNFGPEDYVRRVGVSKRGFAADVTISSLSGRPIIKSLSIDATLGGRLNKSES